MLHPIPETPSPARAAGIRKRYSHMVNSGCDVFGVKIRESGTPTTLLSTPTLRTHPPPIYGFKIGPYGVWHIKVQYGPSRVQYPPVPTYDL
jgi:hypothetical protein